MNEYKLILKEGYSEQNCVICCLKWLKKERVQTEIYEDDARKKEG